MSVRAACIVGLGLEKGQRYVRQKLRRECDSMASLLARTAQCDLTSSSSDLSCIIEPMAAFAFLFRVRYLHQYYT